MKRAGHLMESIADLDNLNLAYYKASRGKRGKSDVAAFAKCIDENLQKLRRQLLSGDFDIGHYRYFLSFFLWPTKETRCIMGDAIIASLQGEILD